MSHCCFEDNQRTSQVFFLIQRRKKREREREKITRKQAKSDSQLERERQQARENGRNVISVTNNEKARERPNKSLHTSQKAYQAGAYPGFHGMKRLGVFLLLLDGMPVHLRVTPQH